MRAQRLAVAIVATLTLAAGAANAQSTLPEDRTNAGPLGTVSMPREVDADTSGVGAITANLTVNASLAREAGAEWILISVGNDNATGLAVTLDELTGANGTSIEAARTEGEGTTRAQWWLAVEDLGETAELRVQASATTNEAITDVETLLVAFDQEYEMVAGEDGEPLVVQSFTTVRNADPVADTGDGTGDGNATGDDNLTDDGATNGTGNGSTDDDDAQESGNDTPAPGFALVLGVLGIAAVAASIGSRR